MFVFVLVFVFVFVFVRGFVCFDWWPTRSWESCFFVVSLPRFFLFLTTRRSRLCSCPFFACIKANVDRLRKISIDKRLMIDEIQEVLDQHNKQLQLERQNYLSGNYSKGKCTCVYVCMCVCVSRMRAHPLVLCVVSCQNTENVSTALQTLSFCHHTPPLVPPARDDKASAAAGVVVFPRVGLWEAAIEGGARTLQTEQVARGVLNQGISAREGIGLWERRWRWQWSTWAGRRRRRRRRRGPSSRGRSSNHHRLPRCQQPNQHQCWFIERSKRRQEQRA